jgi:hypothetical protein
MLSINSNIMWRAIKNLCIHKHDINGRMIRWFLLLQYLYLTILDKPGKQNVVADLFSRLTIPTEEGMIDD